MKNARQTVIIELINKYHIETQEELAERLNQAGFQVTQATVSRDIRELHLIKVADGAGRSRYSVIQNDTRPLNKKYSRVLKDAFVSADSAGNILVVKTVPGMAMAAAAALEAMQFPELVGCIAGDNTIMCAMRSADEALILMEKIRKMLND